MRMGVYKYLVDFLHLCSMLYFRRKIKERFTTCKCLDIQISIDSCALQISILRHTSNALCVYSSRLGLQ